jgi:hypothetical protein
MGKPVAKSQHEISKRPCYNCLCMLSKSSIKHALTRKANDLPALTNFHLSAKWPRVLFWQFLVLVITHSFLKLFLEVTQLAWICGSSVYGYAK